MHSTVGWAGSGGDCRRHGRPSRHGGWAWRLAFASALGLLIAWTDVQGQVNPDFAGALDYPKLNKASGVRPLLVILWDPRPANATGEPLPTLETIEQTLFGPRPSVSDWFRENSGGRFLLKGVNLLGWYRAPAAEDGNEASAGSPPRGWDAARIWTEALRQASQDFDFAAFDRNRDNHLSPWELGVLLVIPQKEPAAMKHTWTGGDYPGRAPLMVGELQLDSVAEWRTGVPPNLGTAAHDLAHLWLGLPDLNQSGPWPFVPGAFCPMDTGAYTHTTHLNPFFKLKLGWLDYAVIRESCQIFLPPVETEGEVLILYDSDRGAEEYFILEYRQPGQSYDAGCKELGPGLPTAGLAVWRVLESPRLFNRVRAPLGRYGEWGRRGIHLIRANGGSPAADKEALFNQPGLTLSADTQPARLCWSDNSPTPFRVTVLGMTPGSIRLQIDVATPQASGTTPKPAAAGPSK